MTHEDERPLLAGRFEQYVEIGEGFIRQLYVGRRPVARADIGRVITANARKSRYRRLDLLPILSGTATTRNEDYGRRTPSGAIAINSNAMVSNTNHSRLDRRLLIGSLPYCRDGRAQDKG